MKARKRRLLALAGGCVAGVGLGGLASTINPYMEAAMLHVDGSFGDALDSSSLWFACLAIGMGLGATLAAVIPDDPEPNLE